MKRSIKVGLLLLAVAFVVALLAVWLRLQNGFSARSEPSAIEGFVARSLRSLSMPTGMQSMKNPVAETEENLAEAMAHFADHCAFCHANDGSGQTPIGRGLYPRPPDMRLSGTQSRSDGELFHTIHNGIRLTGMPAFGDGNVAEDYDSWKLVHFVRRLPRLTPAELEEMKKMNPKSQTELDEEKEMQEFLQGEEKEKPGSKHLHK
ncbi:MAG: c-type cytochrome [Acidobacteriota bacterium]